MCFPHQVKRTNSFRGYSSLTLFFYFLLDIDIIFSNFLSVPPSHLNSYIFLSFFHLVYTILFFFLLLVCPTLSIKRQWRLLFQNNFVIACLQLGHLAVVVSQLSWPLLRSHKFDPQWILSTSGHRQNFIK